MVTTGDCLSRMRCTKTRAAVVAAVLVANVLLYHQIKVLNFTSGNMARIVDSSNTNTNAVKSAFFNATKAMNQEAKMWTPTVPRVHSSAPRSVVNPHNFSRIHSPRDVCSNKTIELVICVPISRKNFEGRRTIRETWGSYASDPRNRAALVFFLGSPPVTPNASALFSQKLITDEAAEFGDILQEEYVDSYQNLSVKSASILKWVSESCPHSKFVLKADDDMFVNIPKLLEILHQQTASHFIIGAVQVGARPIRDTNNKWYTSIAQFKGNVYPNYVSGTAYAFTTNVARDLFLATEEIPLFWLEDIYITGLCARRARVRVINNHRFSLGKPKTSGCTFKEFISGHRYSMADIRKIYSSLYGPHSKCGKRK